MPAQALKGRDGAESHAYSPKDADEEASTDTALSPRNEILQEVGAGVCNQIFTSDPAFKSPSILTKSCPWHCCMESRVFLWLRRHEEMPEFAVPCNHQITCPVLDYSDPCIQTSAHVKFLHILLASSLVSFAHHHQGRRFYVSCLLVWDHAALTECRLVASVLTQWTGERGWAWDARHRARSLGPPQQKLMSTSNYHLKSSKKHWEPGLSSTWLTMTREDRRWQSNTTNICYSWRNHRKDSFANIKTCEESIAKLTKKLWSSWRLHASVLNL